MTFRLRATPLVLALAAALVACNKGDQGGANADSAAGARAAGGDSAAARCPGDNAGLTLPAGFCATVFAESLGHARHVAVASNGDVYVTLESTPPSPENRAAGQEQNAQQAAVVALRDTTRDGKADVVARIPGRGNTGVALVGSWLYVDMGDRIVRYAMTPDPDASRGAGSDGLLPSGAPEVIVSGIPLLPGHRARNIAVGPDSALYVNVGSASNSCQVKERGNESPGKDPCAELQTRAGVWRFDANKAGQRFSPGARFATGLRNGMGLAINPADGALYATQHGRDQLHDNWPKVFPQTEYQAENPGEELVRVARGDDFGWPYCYYAMDEKKLVTAPEYGGDGKKADRCAGKQAPVAAYPGHWAPMSLLFYTGSRFPARYKAGAFIAFHGSWNRAPLPQAGGRVIFQPMATGAAQGDYETFADNFAAMPAAQLQPSNAKHRPVGLAQGPDGALYVTDDMGGRVYRITYGTATR